MTLYELLEENGFTKLLIPEKFWDKMAAKYFWLRNFHTPTYVTSTKWLLKGGIEVYFDDWHVDVHKEGRDRPLITFGKRDTNEVCLKYILNLVEHSNKKDNE